MRFVSFHDASSSDSGEKCFFLHKGTEPHRGLTETKKAAQSVTILIKAAFLQASDVKKLATI